MENISYTNPEKIAPEMLQDFFVGWKEKPTPEAFLKLLENSDYVVLATQGKKVVGFITAITDGVLSAYIPLLEVLPEYQKQGIGAALVKRMLEQLKDFYMIDLQCDADLQPFYEQFGMERAEGMRIRNYSKQGGLNI